jgi:hypothetical protein
MRCQSDGLCVAETFRVVTFFGNICSRTKQQFFLAAPPTVLPLAHVKVVFRKGFFIRPRRSSVLTIKALVPAHCLRAADSASFVYHFTMNPA